MPERHDPIACHEVFGFSHFHEWPRALGGNLNHRDVFGVVRTEDLPWDHLTIGKHDRDFIRALDDVSGC